MTPAEYPTFRIGVPGPGYYPEKINTNALQYGGSGAGNLGGVMAEEIPAHGKPWSIPIMLPALAALIFSFAQA
jgi:1,4-alpha-glucan branching enzyme